MDDISSSSEESIASKDTTIEAITQLLVENTYAKKVATVDALETAIETKTEVPVQKSVSDEGDFEVISKEQLNDMADMQNGVENTGDGQERRFSVSEENEAKDKFPQQTTSKSSNWNTMELGEKRKRLR